MIQQIPEADRPRERLIHCGPELMSTAELIAAIIGSGTKGASVMQLAHELTYLYGNKLADVTIEELCRVKGMGKAKAVQLKAALCLGMRASKPAEVKKQRLLQAKEVYEFMKDELENEKRELLVAIFLDVKGCLICRKIVTIGTLSRTLVHPREVFYFAIRHSASSLILVHNHPSGDPTPSNADRKVTENLIAVGKMMGIPLYDHVIIGHRRYISLRNEGFNFS
jgi:DNA repair protein RadC